VSCPFACELLINGGHNPSPCLKIFFEWKISIFSITIAIHIGIEDYPVRILTWCFNIFFFGGGERKNTKVSIYVPTYNVDLNYLEMYCCVICRLRNKKKPFEEVKQELIFFHKISSRDRRRQ
jgi:hypothetical protein